MADARTGPGRWRDVIGPSPLTQCAPTPQPPSAPWQFVGSKQDRLKDGCNKQGAYSASLIERRRTTQGQLKHRDKVCRREGNRVRSRIHVASGISFRISRSSPRWSLDVNCHFETHLWRRCGARHATCTVCACCTRPGQAAGQRVRAKEDAQAMYAPFSASLAKARVNEGLSRLQPSEPRTASPLPPTWAAPRSRTARGSPPCPRGGA